MIFFSLWNWVSIFFFIPEIKLSQCNRWGSCPANPAGKKIQRKSSSSKGVSSPLLHSIHPSEWCWFQTCNGHLKYTTKELPHGLGGWGSNIVSAVALVIAMAWVWSLTQELPHVSGMAKKIIYSMQPIVLNHFLSETKINRIRK